MKVTLINYTHNAVELLLFTKSTRLSMSPALMEGIHSKTYGEKIAELEYMADTIPSSWEFVDYVFLVEGVSRAYTHQQVRTRAASYAQQSLRVNDADGFDYIFTDNNRRSPAATHFINGCLDLIANTYRQLKEIGQPIEDARGILPTNIATNIVCKFNLRTFVDLVKARSGGRTQDEYQQVVEAMVDEVYKVHSWIGMFLYGEKGRDYFNEIEAFARSEFRDDSLRRNILLKIVDKMRKM